MGQTGEAGGDARGTELDRETVRKWLIDFQRAEVLARYADVDYGDRFMELFKEYMYPDYDGWDAYAARNEMFRWVANVFKSGKLDRLLGAAKIFVGRFVDVMKAEKDIPRYLDAVIESYDIACEIDDGIIDMVAAAARDESDLNPEMYAEAYRECATWEQRLTQIDNLVESGEFAKQIVERGGLIDFMIEHVPLVPLLSRNKFIAALNETLKMVKAAYRAFKESRERIDEIRDEIRRREIGYVESILGPMPEDIRKGYPDYAEFS